MINPKCHNTGCNYPEGECTGACCCNGDCDQGRACPRREMPVQFAGDEPEPIPSDSLLFWLAPACITPPSWCGVRYEHPPRRQHRPGHHLRGRLCNHLYRRLT